MQNKEMVVHPNHYQLSINIEVMDVIEILIRRFNGLYAFQLGNVIKYLLRADKKKGLEDYKKARFYLDLMCKLEFDTNTRTVPKYSEYEKHILKSVNRKMESEELKKCFCAITENRIFTALDTLDRYIKEKENEQTTETKE